MAALTQPLRMRLDVYSTRLRDSLEFSNLRMDAETFVLTLMGFAAASWIGLTLTLHPSPLSAALMMACCFAVTGYSASWYLRQRRRQRIAAFRSQLEGALRTLAGGVRVGLGIRQALVLTAEQSRDPAKSEFMRIVGLSNVGVNTLDAFDQLAARMGLTETDVLARVLRVQSQTGGDLASVLEGLAGTIRDRRRLARRVKAVTAQGRATAWLLGLLPVGVGVFVLTQAELREAMLFTSLGRVFLGIALALDALAIACLMKITRIDA